MDYCDICYEPSEELALCAETCSLRLQICPSCRKLYPPLPDSKDGMHSHAVAMSLTPELRALSPEQLHEYIMRSKEEFKAKLRAGEIIMMDD